MWQRIQTVFLLIAMISLVATIFFPIWVYEDATGKTHALYPLHYTVKERVTNAENRTVNYFPYSITAVLIVASATLVLIEIGKYKKRIVQMKLGALNSLFMAGAMFCAVYFSNGLVKAFPGGSYGLGLWLPAIAVVCNLLANRFIRRDERLVRDSDRLR